MRVTGRSDDITAERYVREVADRLVDRLAALSQRDPEIELPPPDEVAHGIAELVVSRPNPSTNELAGLLGPFWTHARAHRALGTTRQALYARRRNGAVLGVKSVDGNLYYPVSQFERRRDGEIVVRPGLIPLFRALRAFDPWTVGVLLHTAAPELDDTTPLEWVREDRPPDALAALGRTVAREWSDRPGALSGVGAS